MSDIYDAQSYEPRQGVGYLVNRVRTELMAAIDRELAKDQQVASMEMSAAQFIILAALNAGAAQSASDLCKRIQYDAGAMTRMLDRLEEKGLLRRGRDPSDRRLVKLALTERGMAIIPQMIEASIRVLNRFLLGFSRAEASQLESYLTRILKNAPGGT